MSEPVVADRKPAVLELPAGKYWWCACGKSQKQPFCDGAHKAEGEFTPLPFSVTAPLKLALCMCKHTQKPPFCDGSHAKV